MQLSSDYFILPGKDFISQQLGLYFSKPILFTVSARRSPGLSLLPEKQDCLFQYGQNLFLTCEYLRQCLAMRSFLSPASADIYLITIDTIVHCLEWTFSNTAPAVVTFFFVYNQLAVHNSGRFHRANILHLAFPASAADIYIIRGNPLSYNTKIVQIRFYTIIRASSDSNFKFMGQLYLMIAMVKALMYFL